VAGKAREHDPIQVVWSLIKGFTVAATLIIQILRHYSIQNNLPERSSAFVFKNQRRHRCQPLCYGHRPHHAGEKGEKGKAQGQSGS
jgi:hypothetical protein